MKELQRKDLLLDEAWTPVLNFTLNLDTLKAAIVAFDFTHFTIFGPLTAKAKAQLRVLKQESEATEKRFANKLETEVRDQCCFVARLRDELQEQVESLRQEQEHEADI